MRFLFLLFLFISTISYGSIVHWNNRIQGEEIYSNASITVSDGDKDLGRVYTDKSSFCYLRFGLIEGVNTSYLGDFNIQLDLLVTSYDKTGLILSSNIPKTITLHRSTLSEDKLFSELSYTGVSKLSVVVEKISSSQVFSLSNFYLDLGFQAERFYSFDPTSISSMYASLVSYDNQGNETLSHVTFGSDVTLSNTSDILVGWSHIEGAEYYDIEWAWVDNYDRLKTDIPLSSQDYRRNCTRVRVRGQEYRISNTFSKGYLVFRVRGIGVWQDDLDKDLIGDWNEVGLAQKVTVSDWTYVLEIGVAHESLKNWQYQATYAEDGKKKEVVEYFDGSLRGRQTVTRTNSTNQTIVGETIYDNQGRGSLQILPVPLHTGEIRYFDKLNVDENQHPFSYQNIDIPNASGDYMDVLSTTSGASNYYSPQAHTDQTNWQKYVPDAAGYPYTQTIYTPDNTGRILYQGGVGSTHKVTGSHRTEYMYLQPSQSELNRLFGYDIGYKNRYKKNVVIDANGQVSTSYLNASGKVVATALTGPNTVANSGLEDLPNTSLFETTTNTDFLNKTRDADTDTPLDDNHLKATGRFGVYADELVVNGQFGVVNDKEYSLNYSLQTPVSTHTISPICSDGQGTPYNYPYVYDIQINLQDKAATNYLLNYTDPVTQKSIYRTEIDLDPLYTYDTTLFLKQGSYSYSKHLRVNKEALDNYWNHYSSDLSYCLDKYPTMVTVTPETNCEQVSCNACLTSLGANFKNDLAISIYNKEYTALNAGDKVLIDANYQQAVAACVEPCRLALEQDNYRSLMLFDVSPNGQYGEADDNITDVTSIYNPQSVLLSAGQTWRDFIYYDTDRNEAEVELYVLSTDASGVETYSRELIPGTNVTKDAQGKISVKPTDLKNVSDFAEVFKESWANSLLMYHPEYYALSYMEDTPDNTTTITTPVYIHTSTAKTASNIPLSTSEFDAYLEQRVASLSQAKAIDGVYVLETYSPSQEIFYTLQDLTSGSDAIYSVDPYFKFSYPKEKLINGTIDNTVRKRTLMEAKLARYTQANTTSGRIDVSMFHYSMMTALNKDYASVSNITWNDLSDNTQFSEQQADAVWTQYVSYYTASKQQIQQLLLDMYGITLKKFNGYIGEENGKFPLISAWENTLNTADYQLLISDWNTLFGATVSGNTILFNNQPINNVLFQDKQRRVSRKEIPSDSGDDMATITQMQTTADYVTWKQTGACPLEKKLENLTNEVLQTSNFTSALNQTIGVTKLQSMSYDLIHSIAGVSLTDLQNNASSYGVELAPVNNATELEFRLHTPTSTILFLTITAPSNYDWNSYVSDWKVTKFARLFGNGLTGNGLLTIEDVITQQIIQKIANVHLPSSVFDADYTFNACVANYSASNVLDPNCPKLEQASKDIKNLLVYLKENNKMYPHTGFLYESPSYTGSILKETFGINASYQVTSTGIIITHASANTSLTIDGLSELYSSISANKYIALTDLSIYDKIGSILFKENQQAILSDNTPIQIEDSYNEITISYTENLQETALPFSCSCEELKGKNNLKSKKEYETLVAKMLGNIINDSRSSNYKNSNEFTGYLSNYFRHPIYGIDYSDIANRIVTEYLGLPYGQFGSSLNNFWNNDQTIQENIQYYYYKVQCLGAEEYFYYPKSFFISYNSSFFDYENINYSLYCSYSFSIPETEYEKIKNDCGGWKITGIELSTDNQTISLVINNKALVTGYSSCVPDFSNPDAKPCYDCTPIVEPAVSCSDKFASYTSDLTELNLSSIAVSEEIFCSLNYGYISDAYASYLSTLSIQTSSDPLYVSIAEFGATILGYSNTRLATAVQAYGTYVNTTTSPKEWGEWMNTEYQSYLSTQEGYVCPSLIPDPMIEDFVFDPTGIDEQPCDIASANISAVNASSQKEIFLSKEKERFYQSYLTSCLQNAVEKFTETHHDVEHQYTLYYYDQAGNLIRTVPPAGVNRLNLTTQLETSISEARSNATEDISLLPAHSMATEYRYNSLNQLVYQSTPDGGVSRFGYDKLGRLVVSQNAKQAIHQETISWTETIFDENGNLVVVQASNVLNSPQYSYTLYDALGRVFEVGQLTDLSNGLLLNDQGQLVYRESPNTLFNVNTSNWVEQRTVLGSNGSTYQSGGGFLLETK